ncbi:VOC family protein, partial [Sphingomonas sp.]|uniref:VOC family protein n=1 Tax=Sphingomonas sp. TaxID=28214 RepID=UPI002FC72601
MVSYATVGSNNLPKAVAFYDELLGVIGMSKLFDHQSGGRLYGGDKQGMFGVLGPYDGNAATVGNGTMVGFAMKDLDQMAAFHAKAIALGGTDEGAPGPRG